jgi:lipooligosaccharide transport system permease protein
MKSFLYSLIYVPNINNLFMGQVKRNLIAFNRHFIWNIFFLTVEPFLIYLAIGYGIGQMVDPIRSLTYLEFITPAFLILTSTFVSFKEAYDKYYSGSVIKKVYASISTTPMSDVEISLGEIIWATSKGFLATFLILMFSVVSQDISMSFNPILILYIILNAFVFATLGVLLAKFSKKRRGFYCLFIGVIIPLSLICGSFFPLFRLPIFLKNLSLIFPSTHFIFLIRKSYFDLYYSTYFASLGFCLMGSYLLFSYCLNKKSR